MRCIALCSAVAFSLTSTLLADRLSAGETSAADEEVPTVYADPTALPEYLVRPVPRTAQPASGAEAATLSANSATPASLSDRVHTALREAALFHKTKPTEIAPERIHAFLTLYAEVETAEGLSSLTHASLRHLLRTQLTQWQTALEQGTLRLAEPAAQVAESTASGEPVTGGTSVAGGEALLAAHVQSAAALPPALANTPLLAQQFPQPGFTPGMGTPGYGPQAGQTNQPHDHSRELIEIIQDTIAPTSWDVRGGQGVIRYWGNGQALVIRQTGSNQQHIGRLLNNLRQP